MDCRRDSLSMADVASGVGIFPAEGFGVFGVGADVASELAGEVGGGSEHAARFHRLSVLR